MWYEYYLVFEHAIQNPTSTSHCTPEMMYLSLLFASVLAQLQLVSSSSYCATFDAATTAGATGSFSMEINEGVATYKFYLDMTNFQTECVLSSGLSYHIHSYWRNTTTQSSANTFCGSSYCGGHFDPNLACSKSSQNGGSNGLCEAINRTSPEYTYGCNSTVYQNGDYSKCEIGDLGGKLFPYKLSHLPHSNVLP